LKETWCIPPDAEAAFVCAMEDVLDVYQRPYDPKRPLVCTDEGTKQHTRETQLPLPAAPAQAAKEDYEYERNGTSKLFMLTTCWRSRRTIRACIRR